MKNPFIVAALTAAMLANELKEKTRRNNYRLGIKGIKPLGNKAGRYTPHQGKKEIARRARQIGAGIVRCN